MHGGTSFETLRASGRRLLTSEFTHRAQNLADRLCGSHHLPLGVHILRGGLCGMPQEASRTSVSDRASSAADWTSRCHRYWIGGCLSQYKWPPASSPPALRFGGAPSLRTSPDQKSV